MRIKKFNESSASSERPPIEIWCVIVSEVAGWPMEKYCKCFHSEMHAADYLIEYVNDYCEQNFEPFFDNDGERFFVDVEENEDYDAALQYIEQNENDIDIVIVKMPLYKTISKG